MATYKIQYKNGSKLIDTSKKVTLKFKIPDDWNADKVQLATFIDDLGTNPNVNGTVEKTDDGNYFVISTDKLGHYALFMKQKLHRMLTNQKMVHIQFLYRFTI